MKRSDSMGGLISMCPNSTEEDNPMYSREFQTMMEGFDDEGCCIEESGQKKRRLGLDQVKALEKNFEVENKLEPDRKVKLAQELGLQPRQVAVWFQNRRARWKTKQLERDYGVLKASYDDLKLCFEKLQSENESLLKEIGELKSKVDEDGKSDEEPKFETPVEKSGEDAITKVEISSDSDSSAILNEENNNNSINQESPYQEFFNGSSSSSSANFQFSDANRAAVYQPQFVKIEEHNFFGEESCTTFFSDDQAPSLHWYCSDQWN